MSAAPKSPGRHGGRPPKSQKPLPRVPDDTEVVPPKCSRSESCSGTGRHGGRPSQEPQSQSHRRKNSEPLREITVPAKLTPTQDCPESPGVKPVATKKRFLIIYRGNTTLCLMCRLFCWGGSTSVSTASNLEIT